jgi:hypothetical protein
MIIPLPGGVMAVPPGGLTVDGADPTMTLVVERVLDMGNHCDAIGSINGSRVAVRIPEGKPVPLAGASISVSVRRGVEFPGSL